jgi:PAS domain S-box-containing protein
MSTNSEGGVPKNPRSGGHIDRLTEPAPERASIEELAESLERERDFLSALLHTVDALVVVLDTEGRIIRFNRACEQITGYPYAEVRGKRFWDLLLLPEDVEPVKQVFQKLRAGDFPSKFENAWVTRDGVPRLIAWSNTCILDERGDVRYVMGTGIDITEQSRAERERERLLVESERWAAQLDATIASVADGLVIYDASGAVLRTNPAARRMLSYSGETRKMLSGDQRAILEAETPDGRPFPASTLPLARALRGETVEAEIMVFRSPSHPELWVAASAAPIRAHDGTSLGAVATFTNITPLQRLQEQRSQHILGISHGLRTPLTVVQGQAQMLLHSLRATGVNGSLERSAEAVVTSAYRMSIMIRDLVDLMQLETGQPLRLNRVELDPREFVLTLLERLRPLWDVGRVKVESQARVPEVLADPDRLERILINLLSNALKYSSAGSEVVVRLSHRSGRVAISVSDRGDGIPEAEMATLFEPYLRRRLALTSPESLGLGLYITRGLVEAHGGVIGVDTAQGKGSTFSFSLPVASAGEAT